MPDLLLRWDPETASADLVAEAGALATGGDLATAIVVSLMSDRLAEADDVLPDDSTDRRGWWADDGAKDIWGRGAEGFGSRLWLISRAKATEATRALAEEAITEALQWLLDIAAVSRFEISVVWAEPRTRGLLTATVVAWREGEEPVAVRFEPLWRDLK